MHAVRRARIQGWQTVWHVCSFPAPQHWLKPTTGLPSSRPASTHGPAVPTRHIQARQQCPPTPWIRQRPPAGPAAQGPGSRCRGQPVPGPPQESRRRTTVLPVLGKPGRPHAPSSCTVDVPGDRPPPSTSWLPRGWPAGPTIHRTRRPPSLTSAVPLAPRRISTRLEQSWSWCLH